MSRGISQSEYRREISEVKTTKSLTSKDVFVEEEFADYGCFFKILKFRFYINYFSDHPEINFAVLFDDYFWILVIH